MLPNINLKKAITTSLISCAILSTSLSYAEQPSSQMTRTTIPASTASQKLNIINFAAEKGPSITEQVGDDIARQYMEYGISMLSNTTLGFNIIDPKSTFGALFGISSDGEMSSSSAQIMAALAQIQATLSKMIETMNNQSEDLNLLITNTTEYHTFTDLQKLKETVYPKDVYEPKIPDKLTKVASNNNGDDPSSTFYIPTAISNLSANLKDQDIVDYLSARPDQVVYLFGQEKGAISPNVIKNYNQGTNSLKGNSPSDVLPMFLDSYSKNTYVQLESSIINNNGNAGSFVQNANYYLMSLERDFANNVQVDYDIKRMILRTYYYASQKDSPLYNVTIHAPDEGKDISLRQYLWNYYISPGYVIDTTKIDIETFTADKGDLADKELSDEMTGKNSALVSMTNQMEKTYQQISLTNLLTNGIAGVSAGDYTKYLNASNTFKDKCSVIALNDNQLYAQCYEDSDHKKPYSYYLGVDMAAAIPNGKETNKPSTYSRQVNLKEVLFDSGATPHSYLYIPGIADRDDKVTNADFPGGISLKHFTPKPQQLWRYVDYTQSYDVYDKSLGYVDPAQSTDDIVSTNPMGLHFQNDNSNAFNNNVSALDWARSNYVDRNTIAQGNWPGRDSSYYSVMFEELGLRTVKGTPIYYTAYFSLKTHQTWNMPVATYNMTIGCLIGDTNCSMHTTNDQFTGSVSNSHGDITGNDMPYLNIELGKIYDENNDFSVLGRTYQFQYQLDYTTDRVSGDYNWNLLVLLNNHLNLSGNSEVNRIAGNFRDNCHVDSKGNIDYCLYYDASDKSYKTYTVPTSYKDLTTYFLSTNPSYVPGIPSTIIYYPWLDFKDGQLNNQSKYFGKLNDFNSFFKTAG